MVQSSWPHTHTVLPPPTRTREWRIGFNCRNGGLARWVCYVYYVYPFLYVVIKLGWGWVNFHHCARASSHSLTTCINWDHLIQIRDGYSKCYREIRSVSFIFSHPTRTSILIYVRFQKKPSPVKFLLRMHAIVPDTIEGGAAPTGGTSLFFKKKPPFPTHLLPPKPVNRLIAPTVFIDFRLQIASCDCNILPSSVIRGSTAAVCCGFTDYI